VDNGIPHALSRRSCHHVFRPDDASELDDAEHDRDEYECGNDGELDHPVSAVIRAKSSDATQNC
jgi:hypothetical protein